MKIQVLDDYEVRLKFSGNVNYWEIYTRDTNQRLAAKDRLEKALNYIVQRKINEQHAELTYGEYQLLFHDLMAQIKGYE